jgi:cytoskeletal protein CcmA (bactofilin family)
MKRLHNQDGIAMIMVIGIIGLIIILTTTLVMVAGNSENNTMANRQRTQTFDVAEAGLDDAMYTIGNSWPSGITTTASPMPMNYTAFQTSYQSSTDGAEFTSAPSGKSFLNVTWWAPASDPTAANTLWLKSQANVGDHSTAIETEVQREPIGISSLAPGVAVYTGGNLTLSGNSTISGPSSNGQPVASTEVYGNFTGSGNSTETLAPLDIKGTSSFTGNLTPSNPKTGDSTVPSFNTELPASQITALQQTAENVPTNGTVINGSTLTGNTNTTYTSPIYINGNLTLSGNATFTATSVYVNGNVTLSGNMNINIQALYVTGTFSATGNVSLTSLNSTYVAGNATITGNGSVNMPLFVCGGTVTLTGNGTVGGDGVGSDPKPSVVYASSGIVWNGNLTYYGLLATSGTFTGSGNGTVEGQVIAQGNVAPTGNFNVTYNSNVNASIQSGVVDTAALVPGTWSEVAPS